jgi:RNA polymerase sigma factor (sigma-70 family)
MPEVSGPPSCLRAELRESTVRLVERLRSGDREALETLFARYAGPLRRWASGRLPRQARGAADTQDLVQDTLLQTFKNIERFDPQGSGAFLAYLRQGVMNRIRDALRRCDRRGAGQTLDEGFAFEGPSPLEHAIGRELLGRYEQALHRLRPQDREAIVARVELGCTYHELALALNKPTPDAARKAARQALLKLAMEMKHGR